MKPCVLIKFCSYKKLPYSPYYKNVSTSFRSHNRNRDSNVSCKNGVAVAVFTIAWERKTLNSGPYFHLAWKKNLHSTANPYYFYLQEVQ